MNNNAMARPDNFTRENKIAMFIIQKAAREYILKRAKSIIVDLQFEVGLGGGG
jgi:hypothetical protein